VSNALRPTLYGNSHAVSAGHYLAAAAGFAVLEGGGNAIDAGCATGIALAVVHPHEVKFAGVAPIMIRTAAGQVRTIAGLGHWPKRFPADLFMREHGGKMPEGILHTVVPAAPDAWITALRDFGTMSFADIAAASIRICREGFAVYPHMRDYIVLEEKSHRRWAANSALFLPGGGIPNVHDRFLQADLGATLQFMADEEHAAAARGREAGLEAARAAVYPGDIARTIVTYLEEQGSYLTYDDMVGFRSRYEEPVHTRWRDFDVVTCGPWCQGPMLGQALKLVERAGLGVLSHNSVDYIHLLIELLKGAFSDREFRYGDPLFVDVGLDEIMSDAHIAQRVAAVDPRKAYPGLPPPLGHLPCGTAWLEAGELGPAKPETIARDTSYLCTFDKWGNAFSATPSDGNWNLPVVPGTGLIVSGRGLQSRPDPRPPAGGAPGKRPRLTPNPAIAVRDDGSVVPFGTPAGDSQVQAMLQVFLNVFHFGMDVQEAIEVPRFGSWSFPNSFSPYTSLPARAMVEDRLPKDVIDTLRQRGHDIEVMPSFTRRLAAVEMIIADHSSKFLRAGADPRQTAYAIVR
jgi:gamma-glutamyltranspeptidase/glutathione hydrolase